MLANVFATRVGAMPMPGMYRGYSFRSVMLLYSIATIIQLLSSPPLNDFTLDVYLRAVAKDAFGSKGQMGGAQGAGAGSYKPPFKNVEIVYINIKASLYDVKKR